MYPATIVHEGADAEARLRELGIDGRVLREALTSGLTARYSCSDSAPRTGPGLLQ